MKKYIKAIAAGLMLGASLTAGAENAYTPSPENIEARKRFSDSRFGIFIHWGIYSMFGQGEWYLNDGITSPNMPKPPADSIRPISMPPNG